MSSSLALSSLPPSIHLHTPLTRRPSPPRTPVEQPSSRASSSSPSDDSSIIDDLSFEYVQDAEGNYVRLSKGSSKSNQSTPPTPEDQLPRVSESSDPNFLQPKPQSLNSVISPVRRASLSRSESAYPVLNSSQTTSSERVSGALSAAVAAARSFQRVASVPSGVLASGSASAGAGHNAVKPRLLARRVTMEDQPPRGRNPVDELHDLRLQQDEKENIHGYSQTNPSEDPYTLAVAATKKNSPPLSSRSASLSGVSGIRSAGAASLRSGHSGLPPARPLADVPVPQRSAARQVLPSSLRTNRAVKSAASVVANKYAAPNGFEKIAEVDSSDQEAYYERRNDDTEILASGVDHDNYLPVPASAPAVSQGETLLDIPSRHMNHSSSLLSLGSTRPRRSASLSDALSQDDHFYNQRPSHSRHSKEHEAKQPYSRPGTSLGLNHTASDGTGEARRVTLEEREHAEMEKKLCRETYSTDPEPANQCPPTDKGGEPRRSSSPTSAQHARPSFSHKRRDSDTLRSVSYFQSSSSPTVVEGRRPAPIDVPPQRQSPKSRLASVATHRRSPTAPEPPTTSSLLDPCDAAAQAIGKTWAAGDPESEQFASDRERNMKAVAMQRQQLKMQAALPPQPIRPAPTPQSGALGNRHIIVNKKAYARLDQIGKGGSSRVYRVMNGANELYAIKRVSLDKTDADAMNGYMNEIALLKRLEGNARIIRLIDSEVRPGTGASKGWLLLVMECGEIDFARLLGEQQKEPMNLVWIAYYWQQMLQAVQVIHEEKIVHSDLKPANFVLVRGQLKLIDFGIANAIANDTTNIQRDNQVGTVNYMSPEAIESPEGMRRFKVGRQSDVWSLGCILYQMVYGSPPFHSLSMFQKMKAIPDLEYHIEFPEYSTPSIPSSKAGHGSVSPTPPKKLDHLTRKVRGDVIQSMKRCLCRAPKERITIPELLEQEWLTMSEVEVPKVSEAPKAPEVPQLKPKLAENETIINPYYMRQLLVYGIRQGEAMARGETYDVTPEALLKEAERLVIELREIQAQDSSP